MKTLREIQDYVAKDYGYDNMEQILTDYRKGNVTYDLLNDYLNDCLIETQKQQQILINKRVEEDWLSGDFDTQSIINDKNIIR